MSTIELAGKEYPLRYSVNAVCCLEEKLGNLESLMKSQLSCLRGLLWCGLMEGERGLTLEGAGALLQSHLDQGGALLPISQTIARALEEAGFFPHPEGTQQTNPA